LILGLRNAEDVVEYFRVPPKLSAVNFEGNGAGDYDDVAVVKPELRTNDAEKLLGDAASASGSPDGSDGGAHVRWGRVEVGMRVEKERRERERDENWSASRRLVLRRLTRTMIA
jgi:hypothetical protein